MDDFLSRAESNPFRLPNLGYISPIGPVPKSMWLAFSDHFVLILVLLLKLCLNNCSLSAEL
jgi:hypothetical protein